VTLPPPITAARRAANTFVVRHDLVPPVPIKDLLQAHADLGPADWPVSTVDAVMLRRGHERPRVFYRPRPDRPGRERFTLAHELAHVVLPWHLGDSVCTSHTEEVEWTTATEEGEADTFASAVLAPDRWLHDLLHAHGDDMTMVLSELEGAQLSTTASLVALKRVLMAGWVFQMNNRASVFASAGTGASGPYATPQQVREKLDGAAHASGQVNLGGNSVRWWRLFSIETIPAVDDDPRTDTEMIRSAIAAAAPDAVTADKLLPSVNGKVGGGSKDAGGRNAQDIYSDLLFRFRGDQKYRDLLEQPEFEVWLARKARHRAGAAPAVDIQR
jgi:IrrE N-terminal-like domain